MILGYLLICMYMSMYTNPRNRSLCNGNMSFSDVEGREEGKGISVASGISSRVKFEPAYMWVNYYPGKSEAKEGLTRQQRHLDFLPPSSSIKFLLIWPDIFPSPGARVHTPELLYVAPLSLRFGVSRTMPLITPRDIPDPLLHAYPLPPPHSGSRYNNKEKKSH